MYSPSNTSPVRQFWAKTTAFEQLKHTYIQPANPALTKEWRPCWWVSKEKWEFRVLEMFGKSPAISPPRMCGKPVISVEGVFLCLMFANLSGAVIGLLRNSWVSSMATYDMAFCMSRASTTMLLFVKNKNVYTLTDNVSQQCFINQYPFPNLIWIILWMVD